MSIKICALGSGSRGNAFVIYSEDEAILIDAGFSRREILNRLAECRIDSTIIKAVLLTHEHEDHFKGCRVLCDDLNVALYLSSRTAEFLRSTKKLPKKIREFSPGSFFKIGGFRILPFVISHDAIDPVGFVVEYEECKVGLATDLGRMTDNVKMWLCDCNALILESNYDLQMLLNSERTLSLKRRIMGQGGHLNNLDCMQILESLLTQRTSLLLLAHISSECNCRDKVRKIVAERLAQLERTDVKCFVLEQDAPLLPEWTWSNEVMRKNAAAEENASDDSIALESLDLFGMPI